MNDEKIRFSSVDMPAEADPGAAGDCEVYVNSITQKPGEDFVIEGDKIFFFKPIRKEQKLGFFRWLILFIGIAGSYKQNDSVDVICNVGGVRKHHVNLPIDVIVEPTEEQRGMLVGSYSPGG